MTANKNQRHYWGVKEGSEGIGFTGTFTECWEYMVKNFGDKTLNELDQQDIRVTRVH